MCMYYCVLRPESSSEGIRLFRYWFWVLLLQLWLMVNTHHLPTKRNTTAISNTPKNQEIEITNSVTTAEILLTTATNTNSQRTTVSAARQLFDL